MGMIRLSFLAMPLALASGCGESASADGAAAQSTEAESAVPIDPLVLDDDIGDSGELVPAAGGGNAQFDPSCLISPSGVANIALPATLGDFSAAFPVDTAMSFNPAYMVDFGALCVRSNGENAICAIFESYGVEGYRPDVPSTALAVYDEHCRTLEGVGPGTAVADAVAAYGAAVFSFHYENESREYVRFADQPDGMAFRAQAPAGATDPGIPSDSYGGDYSGVEGDGGYFETGRARPDARIWEVWVASAR